MGEIGVALGVDRKTACLDAGLRRKGLERAGQPAQMPAPNTRPPFTPTAHLPLPSQLPLHNQSALDLVSACQAASDAAGVVPSSGDAADDVPAGDLRFCLLRAWAAALGAAAAGREGDPGSRLAGLQSAVRDYKRYLVAVQRLGVLPAEARPTPVSAAGDDGAPRVDPTSARERKVAAFRAQKALEAKLAGLRVGREGGGQKRERSCGHCR